MNKLSTVMTQEARKMYVDGATVIEVIKEHGISEYTLRQSLRADGLLRTRGKRKGKPAKERRPSYGDLKERNESKHFTSSTDILNKAFKPTKRAAL